MLLSDGIFVGEMIDYEPSGFDGAGKATQALVTYRIEEVLKGQIADLIEVHFPPINYRVPDSRESQGPEIVSFRRIRYEDDAKNAREFNFVLGGPCVGIYVLDGRQQNVAAVKGWIADGIARPSELYSESADKVSRARAKAEKRMAERRAARGLPPKEKQTDSSVSENASPTSEQQTTKYAYFWLVLLGLGAAAAVRILWKLADQED